MQRQRKLGHDKYEEYLVLCRDNYIGRKRALDAIREAELQAMLDTAQGELVAAELEAKGDTETVGAAQLACQHNHTSLPGMVSAHSTGTV